MVHSTNSGATTSSAKQNKNSALTVQQSAASNGSAHANNVDSQDSLSALLVGVSTQSRGVYTTPSPVEEELSFDQFAQLCVGVSPAGEQGDEGGSSAARSTARLDESDAQFQQDRRTVKFADTAAIGQGFPSYVTEAVATVAEEVFDVDVDLPTSPNKSDNYLSESEMDFPRFAQEHVFKKLGLMQLDEYEREEMLQGVTVDLVKKPPSQNFAMPTTSELLGLNNLYPLSAEEAYFCSSYREASNDEKIATAKGIYESKRAEEKINFEKELSKLQKNPKEYKTLNSEEFEELERHIEDLRTYNKIQKEWTFHLNTQYGLDSIETGIDLPEWRLEKVPAMKKFAEEISHKDYKKFLEQAGADVDEAHFDSLKYAAYQGFMEAAIGLPQKEVATLLTSGISQGVLQFTSGHFKPEAKSVVRVGMRPGRVFADEMLKHTTTQVAINGLPRHAQVQLPEAETQNVVDALEPVVDEFVEYLRSSCEEKLSSQKKEAEVNVSPTQEQKIRENLARQIEEELKAHYALHDPDSDTYQSDERSNQKNAVMIAALASSIAETIVIVVGANVLAMAHPSLTVLTPMFSLFTRPAAAVVRQAVANWYDSNIIGDEALAYYSRLEEKDNVAAQNAQKNGESFNEASAKQKRLEALTKYIQNCFLTSAEADRLHRLRGFNQRLSEYEVELKATQREIEDNLVLSNILSELPSSKEFKKLKENQKQQQALYITHTYQKYHVAKQILEAQKELDKLYLEIHKKQEKNKAKKKNYLEQAHYLYEQALKIKNQFPGKTEANLAFKEFVNTHANNLLPLQIAPDKKSRDLFQSVFDELKAIDTELFVADLRDNQIAINPLELDNQEAIIKAWLVYCYKKPLEVLKQQATEIYSALEKERSKISSQTAGQLAGNIFIEVPYTKEERLVIEYCEYLEESLHQLQSIQDLEKHIVYAKEMLENPAYISPESLLKNFTLLQQKRIDKAPHKQGQSPISSAINAGKKIGGKVLGNIGSLVKQQQLKKGAESLIEMQEKLANEKKDLFKKRKEAFIEEYKLTEKHRAYKKDLEKLNPSESNGGITEGGELYRNIASRLHETKHAINRRWHWKNIKKIVYKNKSQLYRKMARQTATQAFSGVARAGYKNIKGLNKVLTPQEELEIHLKKFESQLAKNTAQPTQQHNATDAKKNASITDKKFESQLNNLQDSQSSGDKKTEGKVVETSNTRRRRQVGLRVQSNSKLSATAASSGSAQAPQGDSRANSQTILEDDIAERIGVSFPRQDVDLLEQVDTSSSVAVDDSLAAAPKKTWDEEFEESKTLSTHQQKIQKWTELADRIEEHSSPRVAVKKLLDAVNEPSMKDQAAIGSVLANVSLYLSYLETEDENDASDQTIGWGKASAWRQVFETFKALSESEKNSATLANLAYSLNNLPNRTQRSSAFKELFEVATDASFKDKEDLGEVIYELSQQIKNLDDSDETGESSKISRLSTPTPRICGPQRQEPSIESVLTSLSVIGWGKETAWNQLLTAFKSLPIEEKHSGILSSLISQINELPTASVKKSIFLSLKTNNDIPLLQKKGEATEICKQLTRQILQNNAAFTAQEVHDNLRWIRGLTQSLSLADQCFVQIEMAQQIGEYDNSISNETVINTLSQWIEELYGTNDPLLLRAKNVGSIGGYQDTARRTEEYSSILAAINSQTPAKNVVDILSILALNLETIPANARKAQWDSLLSKFEALPVAYQDSSVLTALLTPISDFSPEEKVSAYTRLLSLLKDRPPFAGKKDISETLISLIHQIKADADIKANYDSLLSTAQTIYDQLHENEGLVLAYKRSDILAAIVALRKAERLETTAFTEWLEAHVDELQADGEDTTQVADALTGKTVDNPIKVTIPYYAMKGAVAGKMIGVALSKLGASSTNSSLQAWVAYKNLLIKIQGLSASEINFLELPNASIRLKGRALLDELDSTFNTYLLWLSGQVDKQPAGEQRVNILTRTLSAIDPINPPVNVTDLLSNLASSLGNLPDADKYNQWQQILQKFLSIPAAQQDKRILTVLSEQIKTLAKEEKNSALDGIFSALKTTQSHLATAGDEKSRVYTDVSATVMVLVSQVSTEDLNLKQRLTALSSIAIIYSSFIKSQNLELTYPRNEILAAITAVVGGKIKTKDGRGIDILDKKSRETYFRWIVPHLVKIVERGEAASVVLAELQGLELEDAQKSEMKYGGPYGETMGFSPKTPDEMGPRELLVYVINQTRAGTLAQNFDAIQSRLDASHPSTFIAMDKCIVLALLAQQMRYLSSVDQLTKWRSVFEKSKTLDFAKQGQVFNILAEQISFISSKADRQTAYDELFAAVKTNTDQGADKALITLTKILKTLDLESKELWKRWKNIKDVLNSSTYKGKKAAVLASLSTYIEKIGKSTDKGEAFQYIARLVDRHIGDEDMSAVVVALATSINNLPEDEKNVAFADRENTWTNSRYPSPAGTVNPAHPGIWDLFKKLKPTQQLSTLSVLSTQIDKLPKKLRVKAFDDIAQAAKERLEDGEAIGDVVAILASKIHYFGRAIGTANKGKAWGKVWQLLTHPQYLGDKDEAFTWLAMQINELPQTNASNDAETITQTQAFNHLQGKQGSIEDIHCRRIVLSCLASRITTAMHDKSVDEQDSVRKKIWNELLVLKGSIVEDSTSSTVSSQNVALQQLSRDERKQFLKLFLDLDNKTPSATTVAVWQPNWYLPKISAVTFASVDDYINSKHEAYSSGINQVIETLIAPIKKLPVAQQPDAIRKMVKAISLNTFSDDSTINAALFGVLIKNLDVDKLFAGSANAGQLQLDFFKELINNNSPFINDQAPAGLKQAANKSFILRSFIAQIENLPKGQRKEGIQSVLKYLPGLYYLHPDLVTLINNKSNISLSQKIEVILTAKGLGFADTTYYDTETRTTKRMANYAVREAELARLTNGYSNWESLKNAVELAKTDSSLSQAISTLAHYEALGGNAHLNFDLLPTLRVHFKDEFGIPANGGASATLLTITDASFDAAINSFDIKVTEENLIESYRAIIRAIPKLANQNKQIEAIKKAIALLTKIDDSNNNLRTTLALSLVSEVAHLPSSIRLKALETILDEALPFTKTRIAYNQISNSNSDKNHASYSYIKEGLLSRDSQNVIRRKEALEFLVGVSKRLYTLGLSDGEKGSASENIRALWTDTDNRDADIDPNRKLSDRIAGTMLSGLKYTTSLVYSEAIGFVAATATGGVGAFAIEAMGEMVMDELLDAAFKADEEAAALDANEEMFEGAEDAGDNNVFMPAKGSLSDDSSASEGEQEQPASIVRNALLQGKQKTFRKPAPGGGSSSTNRGLGNTQNNAQKGILRPYYSKGMGFAKRLHTRNGAGSGIGRAMIAPKSNVATWNYVNNREEMGLAKGNTASSPVRQALYTDSHFSVLEVERTNKQPPFELNGKNVQYRLVSEGDGRYKKLLLGEDAIGGFNSGRVAVIDPHTGQPTGQTVYRDLGNDRWYIGGLKGGAPGRERGTLQVTNRFQEITPVTTASASSGKAKLDKLAGSTTSDYDAAYECGQRADALRNMVANNPLVNDGKNAAAAHYTLNTNASNNPQNLQGSLWSVSGPGPARDGTSIDGGSKPTALSAQEQVQINDSDRQFTAIADQATPTNTRPNPRTWDTEIKILENIDKQIRGAGGDPKKVSGTVMIWTIKPPCVSCAGAMRQFKAKYPKIKLLVGDGNPGWVKSNKT